MKHFLKIALIMTAAAMVPAKAAPDYLMRPVNPADLPDWGNARIMHMSFYSHEAMVTLRIDGYAERFFDDYFVDPADRSGDRNMTLGWPGYYMTFAKHFTLTIRGDSQQAYNRADPWKECMPNPLSAMPPEQQTTSADYDYLVLRDLPTGSYGWYIDINGTDLFSMLRKPASWIFLQGWQESD